MFKVLISGGRTQQLGKHGRDKLGRICSGQYFPEIQPDIFMHGGAPGIDTEGAEFIAEYFPEIEVQEFKADWAQYKHAAGPIRNRAMCSLLHDGDVVLIFPGGSGTRDLADQAYKRAKVISLTILDYR